MIKLLLLGLGLLFVFEGLLYFFLSNKLNSIIEQLSKTDPQVIKILSVILIAMGTCLIYFTFKLYGEY